MLLLALLWRVFASVPVLRMAAAVLGLITVFLLSCLFLKDEL